LKFKLDENLRQECAAVFRHAGLPADTVAEENLSGADDSALFERCKREDRILIILDLDFSDVREYAPGSHPGVIVLRPSSQEKQQLIALSARLANLMSERSPAKQLWIVDERRVRIRES